jgi:selenophosphate synthase
LKAEFALLDFLDLHRGEKVGYTVVNSSSLKIIDPTQNPESDTNTAISLASPLEYLALMGCTSGFRIVPIYDAPNEDMINCIQNGHSAFSSRHNIPIDDYSSLNIRKLFLGGTAFANTEKSIPARYDLVKEGMVIILTEKFGSLCPLNVRIVEKIYPGLNGFNNLNGNFGPSISNDILKSLGRPRLSLGKIVAKYSPDFGNKFDIDSNIIAVHPVLTDGIISLLHLARLSNCHLLIKNIPMEYEQLARSVTNEQIVSNSTSSVNGCHLIVAGNGLADDIVVELRKHNFDPMIIGNVVDQGKSSVTISNQILNYVAANYIVNRFQIIK